MDRILTQFMIILLMPIFGFAQDLESFEHFCVLKKVLPMFKIANGETSVNITAIKVVYKKRRITTGYSAQLIFISEKTQESFPLDENNRLVNLKDKAFFVRAKRENAVKDCLAEGNLKLEQALKEERKPSSLYDRRQPAQAGLDSVATANTSVRNTMPSEEDAVSKKKLIDRDGKPCVNVKCTTNPKTTSSGVVSASAPKK